MALAVNSSIKRYRGKWTKEQTKHLLKRTMFGATKEDIEYFSAQSLHKTIKELIYTEEEIPSPPINNYNETGYADPEITPGETWVTANKQTGKEIGKRKNSLKSWWFALLLNQNRTISEKMVLFWHNHFATEMNQVDNATWSYKHNVLLRQYALGNFKAMVKAITLDPCMLKYLNGYNNIKKAPDENYGRELQELFTVGKGKDSHYTEADVKAAARVLTGFKVENKILSEAHAIFDATRHDENDKQFSEFYNKQTIAGIKGSDAEKELDHLIDMIFEQEEVSKFICRKLYRYFVYYKIDDATEKNIITPLAKTFRKNKYEIKPVLEQLLSSRHFFDDGNKGSIIKSPIDFVVGLCREYKIQLPDSTDYTLNVNKYGLCLKLQTTAAQMLQSIGDPPNVAGWQAYYQEPQYDKIWINSDTLPKRNRFTDNMINNGIADGHQRMYIDPVMFAQKLSNPSNPDSLINESIQLLYMMDLPEKEKQYLKEGILLSGLQGMMSNHYWTDAWNKLQTNPNDAANKKDVTAKLKKLYQYLMNLPQYQLC